MWNSPAVECCPPSLVVGSRGCVRESRADRESVVDTEQPGLVDKKSRQA